MEWTEGAPCNCQTLRHHVKVAFGPNSAALAELDRLVGEVERLRGVVEAAKEMNKVFAPEFVNEERAQEKFMDAVAKLEGKL